MNVVNEWDAISKPATAADWDAISTPDRRKQPRSQNFAAPERDYSADAGMSGWEKAAVGAGRSVAKGLQGLKGLVGMDTGQDEEDAALYAKHRPKGWQTTAGEIAGEAGMQAPLALVPGGIFAQMAAQGAGSAALQPGDLEERAKAGAMGAGGAAAGHLLTKALARTAKPIGEKAADTVALEAMGVMPTFGQGMAQKGTKLGKAINMAEEGAMAVPIASGPLRGARERALGQWQKATRESVLPPGAPAGASETVDATKNAISNAYERALSSEQMPYASVLYQPDIRKLSAGLPLTKDAKQIVEDTFQEIRMKHMQNVTPGAQATAAGAHGTESELKTIAADYMGSQDPAQRHLGKLFDKVAREYGSTWRGALRNPTTRNAIADLDKAYPGFAAIRQAAKTVGAAASEGVPSAYTPAVLTRAARTVDRTPNKTQYIAGDAPMQEMARLGQTIQSKLPDSGTATRQATMAGLGLGGAHLFGLGPHAVAGALALAGYGTKAVQDFMMGRAAPKAQEAMMKVLQQAAPLGAAAGAGAANNQQVNPYAP